MLSRLQALPFLQPLFTLRDESPHGRGRYVQLTNWLGVVSAIVCLFYIAGYMIAGEVGPMLAVVGMLGASIVAIVLNVRGSHYAARHLLLSACNLCIFVFGAWLGRDSGVYLTYFITMANTILLFPPQNLKHIAYALMQPFVMILLLHFMDEPLPLFGHAASGMVVRNSNIASMLMTATLLLVTLVTFSKEILRSERMAEEALGRLDREMSLVKHSAATRS